MKKLALVLGVASLAVLIAARVVGENGTIPAAETMVPETMTIKTEEFVFADDNPQAAEEPESHYIVYDIPLSEELQNYTQDVCEAYGVSYPLALAVIEKESRYDPEAVSSTNDYGLMQINQMNHEWLGDTLGITDWLDPEQNILAGVYVLSQFDYKDQHQILMSYNCGPTGAKKLWSDGVYSTAYSRAIVETLNGLEVMTNE